MHSAAKIFEELEQYQDNDVSLNINSALDSALAPVLDPLSNLPNGETRKSTIADDTSVN